MKTRIGLGCVAFIGMMAVHLQAGELPSVAPKLFSVPPAIDGKLTEPAWQETLEAGPFFDMQNVTWLIKNRTTFKIGYDALNLYLGVICLDSGASSKQVWTVVGDDDGIFKDDSVEIFIDPERQGQGYYQFVINKRGTIWDARNQMSPQGVLRIDRQWNGGIRAAVSYLSDRWMLEVAIPLSSLEVKPQLGKKWGLGVNRNLKRCERDANGNLLDVFVMWSPSSKGFHDLPALGNLWFGGEAEILASLQKQVEELKKEALPLNQKIADVLKEHTPRRLEFERRRAELFDPVLKREGKDSLYLMVGNMQVAMIKIRKQWQDLYYDILFTNLLGE